MEKRRSASDSSSLEFVRYTNFVIIIIIIIMDGDSVMEEMTN